MHELHPLLRRQWRRHLGQDEVPADAFGAFARAVSEAYNELDSARRLVERALALSSAELHAANAELRGVVQVLPDLLFRVQSNDQVTGVTQGSAATAHPALRSLAEQSSDVAALFRRTVEQVRATRAPASFEYVHTSERGAAYFEVRLLPFVDSDIIGIVRDISDHKHAEHDRLILGKLESTGILAGGIAHDFNNLLTSILLNVDMAMSPDALAGEMDEYLSTIRNGVLAAQLLTQQLITFARGGTGVREPIVLTELIRESVSLVLSGSNLRGDINIAPDLWTTKVDAGQIGQVVRNLVLNAREAMPSGGVVSVRAENVALDTTNAPGLPDGNYVRFGVADQGSGISAEAMPKIFDPYFSTKMRGPQKGMGLGLTICHSVVQKHGGAISLESVTGTGSTFTVYLPALAGAVVAHIDATPEEGRAPRRCRILVMDDEPMVLRAFKNVLKQLNYDAVLVPDGRTAVEAFIDARDQDAPFDAVILDLTIKGEMGGKDAARELLAIDSSVRAIVMSGYSEDDVMRGYERFGFKGRLTKPFDREALHAVLLAVLAD